jgi:RecA-family ATPase
MLSDNEVARAFAINGIGLPAQQQNEPPAYSEIPEWADQDAVSNNDIAAAKLERLPPLTMEDWRTRDLPAPDFIVGNCISTTTRWLISAETGIGKSMFLIALGQHASAGLPFLHWDAPRPVKTLYVDGEMSRRLLKERLLSEGQRHGGDLHNFHVLSREDLEGFQPLNRRLVRRGCWD